MNVLAIETSTMLGGVAVANDDQGLVAEVRLNVKTTHSERLMTALDYALAQSDLVLDEVDVIAVAAGPGSFTGLRIGLSAAKGLCYAAGKRLVLVPTLEAFAWNFPFSRYPVCPMLDARKGEVYAAVFTWVDDGFEQRAAENPVSPETLLEKIDGPVVLAGDGAYRYRDRIRQVLGSRALFAPLHHMVPSPANVALVGLRMAEKQQFADPASAAPLYIRRSEAETKREEKQCPASG